MYDIILSSWYYVQNVYSFNIHYFYSVSTEYLTDGLSVETNLDLLVDALESIAFKNTA